MTEPATSIWMLDTSYKDRYARTFSWPAYGRFPDAADPAEIVRDLERAALETLARASRKTAPHRITRRSLYHVGPDGEQLVELDYVPPGCGADLDFND